MFGDDLAGDAGGVVRVCCGPRCGAEPDHRRIYAAVENAAHEATLDREAEPPLAVRPVMCQGHCGMGVTLVMPDGETAKIRAPIEAREKILVLGGY